jgi:uncharacterized membrane protein YkoI
MYTRNALVFVIASIMSAAVAGAQQPKQATPARSKTTTQAPAAKPAAKTSTAQALPINSDSAKKIVIANEPGATVTSTHLHRASGKAWYTVNFKAKGEKKTMHATVDASSGAFATVAPAAPATKPAAKKPS